MLKKWSSIIFWLAFYVLLIGVGYTFLILLVMVAPERFDFLIAPLGEQIFLFLFYLIILFCMITIGLVSFNKLPFKIKKYEKWSILGWQSIVLFGELIIISMSLPNFN